VPVSIWGKVKAKGALERKLIREVIFESHASGDAGNPNKKRPEFAFESGDGGWFASQMPAEVKWRRHLLSWKMTSENEDSRK